jgi:hypothetical protein
MYPQKKLPWFSLVAALLLAACSGEDGEGSVQLYSTVDQSITAAEVAEVQVTVSASDMPSRTEKLLKTNNQWSGTLGKLPAGTNRTITAEAFDAGGTRLYAGSVTGVTIAARQTTVVSITLQEVNPPQPFENAAPVVAALSASPASVDPGGVVSLSATATDANAGDVLTYAWSAPTGTFTQPGSLSTSWTAPSAAGNVPLTLTVTDSKGAQGRMTFTVSVTAGHGGATVNASFNTWPRVSNVSATATVVAVNEPTTVTALASDNDGDMLIYNWSASCPGTWTDRNSATARFVPTASPDSNTCNNCNLTVMVMDFRNGPPIGGRTTGTLSICVNPQRTTSSSPNITETFQSATSASANGGVTFRARAVDPQSSAMSFSWAANMGTVGAANTSANASELAWTAPACAPEYTTPTITATVTNALGLSTSHGFTVTGLPTCVPVIKELKVTRQGCGYSLKVLKDINPDPYPQPLYRIIVQSEVVSPGTCTLVPGSVELGTSKEEPRIALAANDEGVVAAYSHGGYTRPYLIIRIAIKRLDPNTLGALRVAGLAAHFVPENGGAGGPGALTLNGLTLHPNAIEVNGTFIGNSVTEDPTTQPWPYPILQGSNFVASYPDFFGTTQPPSIVSF